MAKKNYKDYASFLAQVGHGQLDGVEVTHAGDPLSIKESKFIDQFLATGNLNQSLKESGLTLRAVTGKDYITDEIQYRLEELKKETIADADEIMQYFTKVMRGEIQDQFGLDAPLSERTAAAKELARRVIDVEQMEQMMVQPEIKVTLNFEGLE